MRNYPEILFPEDTDEFDLQDADMKGLFAFDVRISPTVMVRVSFIKLSSFEEHVKLAEESGQCFVPPKNTVVLTELTKEKMHSAVYFVFDSDYLE